MTETLREPSPRRSLWKGPATFASGFLILPLLGSMLIDGWRWHPVAFVVLWLILFGLGLLYRLATRNRDAIAYRAALILAMVASFVVLWGNLVQWSDVNRAAVVFFGVPLVAAVGAAIARLRPRGMSVALLVTAMAQGVGLVVATVSLLSREPDIAEWTPPEWRGLVGNAVNGMFYAASAWLFQKSARVQG